VTKAYRARLHVIETPATEPSLTPAERGLVVGWAVVSLAANAAALGAIIGVGVLYEGSCMLGRAALRAVGDR